MGDSDITELFCELVRVPSPSGHERAVAELIAARLAAVGVDAELDGSGARNDSDAGNLIATVPGAAGAPTFLFVAHMDTVETGAPAIEPRVGEDGVIRSGGDTILGADNKSAVAAVMTLCRAAGALPADRRPTVIAAFTCREEAGKMGASLLDLAARGVDQAFCVDGSHPIGTVIDRSLGQTVWTLEVRGRRAHSALNPEQGVNAIAVASEIVAALPLGRQEHGGSLGVASIVGGALVARMDSGLPAREALARTPTNSVPDVALLRGEARGYTDRDVQETLELVRHMALGVCIGHGATFIFSPDEHGVPPMPGGEVSHGVELLRTAAREVPGVEIDVHGSPSTLEANYLARLCDTVAVSSGGREPHQTSESIEVRELTQLTELLTAVVRAGCLAEG